MYYNWGGSKLVREVILGVAGHILRKSRFLCEKNLFYSTHLLSAFSYPLNFFSHNQ